MVGVLSPCVDASSMRAEPMSFCLDMRCKAMGASEWAQPDMKCGQSPFVSQRRKAASDSLQIALYLYNLSLSS